MRQLRSENLNTRATAIGKLGQSGDSRAVEPLAAALLDKDSILREAAAEALGRIDPNWARSEAAKRVGPALVAALRNEDCGMRRAAAEILGKIADTRAVEPLVVALRDTEYRVRQVAAETLGRIGDSRALEPLMAGLGDHESDVRKAATEALERIDPNWARSRAASRAVPIVLEALNHKNSAVRQTAAAALGKIGDARAVEPLVAALEDSVSDVRREAATELDRIDPDWRRSEAAKRAVPTLLEALKDRAKQWAAAEVLGSVGDARAVEPLMGVLTDQHAYTDARQAAAEALAKIADRRAVGSLVAVLPDKNKHVRQAAAQALDQIDPSWAKSEAAKQAVPTLVAALAYNDSNVQLAAAEALGKIADGRAVEPLAAALGDEDLHMRQAAGAALDRIDANWPKCEAAKRAVPALVAALRHSAEDARKGARSALERIDRGWAKSEAAKRAVPTLVAALKRDKDADVRMHAAAVLGEIGDGRALGPLAAAVADGYSDVQRAAKEALGNLDDARAVEPLLVMLKGGDCELRCAAAKALGNIGDPRAMEPLVATLKENDYARHEAVEALVEIGGSAVIETLTPLLSDRGLSWIVAGALASLGWQPANDVQRAWLALARRNWGELANTGAAAVVPLISVLQIESVGAGEDFSAREIPRSAIDTLYVVLTSSATGVAAEDLRRVGGLKDIPVYSYQYYGYRESDDDLDRDHCERVEIEAERPIDCSRVRDLARQELGRRGLEV